MRQALSGSDVSRLEVADDRRRVLVTWADGHTTAAPAPACRQCGKRQGGSGRRWLQGCDAGMDGLRATLSRLPFPEPAAAGAGE